ncbi:hypothetical protein VB716_15475 [Synechococcus sp. CCY9201]|nr:MULTISPECIES: hypothetical protein [unclassified Synechococcus]MEA5475620.1 hypothetical protein [Synechococcus sp. CCY9201]QPN59192.1 hypothetical protein H8F24_14100 [Synechococcus sp. CBW1002]
MNAEAMQQGLNPITIGVSIARSTVEIALQSRKQQMPQQVWYKLKGC